MGEALCTMMSYVLVCMYTRSLNRLLCQKLIPFSVTVTETEFLGFSTMLPQVTVLTAKLQTSPNVAFWQVTWLLIASSGQIPQSIVVILYWRAGQLFCSAIQWNVMCWTFIIAATCILSGGGNGSVCVHPYWSILIILLHLVYKTTVNCYCIVFSCSLR